MREADAGLEVPLLVQPHWRSAFPWLLQGTTAGATADPPFDLGLFGGQPVGETHGRWRRLRQALGCAAAVHARQVHGDRVLVHASAGHAGLAVLDDADGHATAAAGLLLTVSVADCVPTFVVAPEQRAIALLHSGWRGTAANILAAGLATLERLVGARPNAVHVHVGPAICGDCYEVGPEVHEALGEPRPAGPTPVDLRRVILRQALAAGVPAASLSRSELCTLCGDAGLFSHRGGHGGRQMAVLAVSPA